jgi:branched-subunit amino acid aminotransferase/4-amino-4-deoxychorismate lyase
MAITAAWLHWHDGTWHKDEYESLSLRDNSLWLGNAVFDGARAFSNATELSP